MKPPANFQVKTHGIDPNFLTELQGPSGPFYITHIGGKPEMEHGFFYGDKKYQFCFYANYSEVSEVEYDVDVDYYTTERFRGKFGFPIPTADAQEFENNIKLFFETQSFWFNQRPILPNQRLRQIRFSWTLNY